MDCVEKVLVTFRLIIENWSGNWRISGRQNAVVVRWICCSAVNLRQLRRHSERQSIRTARRDEIHQQMKIRDGHMRWRRELACEMKMLATVWVYS